MRVIVYGGRTYAGWLSLVTALDKIHDATPITLIVEGGARGADRLGREWAILRGVPYVTYEADWENDGKSAGPKRNQRMLVEGKPDIGVQCPGAVGTADMRQRLYAAKVRVVEVVGR